MRTLLCLVLLAAATPFAASETLEAASVRAGARFGEGPNAGMIDGPSVTAGSTRGAYRADLSPSAIRRGGHDTSVPDAGNENGGGILANKGLWWGAGGALAGAAAGFWIGTSVFPGVGSLWGAVMGGLIGGGAGMMIGGAGNNISKAALYGGLGMAAGFALGSVVPVVGSFWGMMIGGLVGAAAGFFM